MTSNGNLDLPSYLARVGMSAAPAATLEGLRALHLAHATHIPFENLDVLMGRPVRIDLASVQDKLVARRRGGYCFEHSTLFQSVLETLGFAVRPLAGRVRLRVRRTLPRTHMLLLVDCGGEAWIADVGFGAEGMLLPVRFDPAHETPQFGWRYRVIPEKDEWVLQSLHPQGWTDLYVFTLAAQLPIDFEMANHYTSTHPDSRFLHTLMVQRTAPGARYVLRNRVFTVSDGLSVPEPKIVRDDALLEVLAEHFGLTLPTGTSIPFDEHWD